MTFLGNTEERGKAVDTMAFVAQTFTFDFATAKALFTNQPNRLTI